MSVGPEFLRDWLELLLRSPFFELDISLAHPNYPRYTRCIELSVSHSYDAQLSAKNTYSEAWKAGFLNPLDLDTIPGMDSVPPSWHPDPYFQEMSMGASLRGEAVAKLKNFTEQIIKCGTFSRGLTLWEFVALPEAHPGNPDPVPLDDQWRLFRAIYLGLKHQFEAQFPLPEPACPCDDCGLSTDIPFGEDSLTDILTSETFDDALAATSAVTDSFAETYCPVRVEDWLARLNELCSLPRDIQAALRDLLTNYCLYIAGESNPLAQMSAEDLTQHPALVAAQELLPSDCNLNDLIEDPALVTEEKCISDCCTQFDPSKCLDVLRELTNSLLSSEITSLDLPSGFRKNCLSWAEKLILIDDRIEISGLNGLNEMRETDCTIWFIDEDGALLDLSGLLWIQAFAFSSEFFSELPEVADLNTLGQYQGIVAELKFENSSGTYMARGFLFSDCDLDFFTTQEVLCPDVSDDLCKPIFPSFEILGLEILRRYRIPRERAENLLLPWPYQEIPPSGGKSVAECGPIKEAAGCTLVAMKLIEQYIEENQSFNIGLNECFFSFIMGENSVGFEYASDAEKEEKGCAYAFYTGYGEIVEIARIDEIIGDPIHASELPSTFDSNEIRPSSTFTTLKVKTRLVFPDETEWLYVFATCEAELQDMCREIPVAFTFDMPPPLDITERCANEVSREAERAARQEWDERIETETELFRRKFRDNAFAESVFTENFMYSTKDTEHHHVLYYYDQAGNLVQTVPPEGVEMLTEAQTNAHLAEADNVQNPSHRMLSESAYNSMNNLRWLKTPDSGKKRFWYNNAGQLRFTQTAQQNEPPITFTYIKYDKLNRVVQVGVISGISQGQLEARIESPDFPCDPELDGNCGAVSYTLSDKTISIYDSYDSCPAECATLNAEYLHGRLAAVIRDAGDYGNVLTYYGYDSVGNEITQIQSIPGVDGPKRIDYEYDIANGNLKAIHYQTTPDQNEENLADQFHHRYEYLDSRLVAVYTSRDGYNYEKDASYKYYKHGPIARLELGQNKVQGVDYAYTLQGWFKGVNRNTLDVGTTPDVVRDIGKDGDPNGEHAGFARDAFGFTLGYFPGDYKSIREAECEKLGPSAPANCWVSFEASTTGSKFLSDAPAVYDGSISHSVVANRALLDADKGGVIGSAYRYDQLNRLVEANVHTEIDIASNAWPSNTGTDESYDMAILQVDPRNEVSGYDANGNIKWLKRYGPMGSTAVGYGLMDDLEYEYPLDTEGNLVSNQLQRIKEDVTTAPPDQYVIDIDHQPENNYKYDADGNLKSDISENISDIKWNAYGRVTDITLVNIDEDTGEASISKTIEYLYDGNQNRVCKIITEFEQGEPGTVTYGYFVRNTTGDLVASYERILEESYLKRTRETITAEDLTIFGLKRLGVLRPELTLCDRNLTSAASPGSSDPASQTNPGVMVEFASQKLYELTDQVGSVRATVSGDTTTLTNSDGVIFAEANLLNAVDYYAFGMEMPGRIDIDAAYNYGFDGYERDDDIKGRGNSYYTSGRLYDPRCARWISPDPLLSENSPFIAFGNNPVSYVDPNGMQDSEADLRLELDPYFDILTEASNFDEWLAYESSYAGWLDWVEECGYFPSTPTVSKTGMPEMYEEEPGYNPYAHMESRIKSPEEYAWEWANRVRRANNPGAGAGIAVNKLAAWMGEEGLLPWEYIALVSRRLGGPEWMNSLYTNARNPRTELASAELGAATFNLLGGYASASGRSVGPGPVMYGSSWFGPSQIGIQRRLYRAAQIKEFGDRLLIHDMGRLMLLPPKLGRFQGRPLR